MSNQPVKIGMKPSHPAEFIREEVLDVLNLSETQCADILGISQQTLSDFLRKQIPLSPELALRIEKAFKISMDTLLKMQAWHDSYMMRQREDEIPVQEYQQA